MTTTGVAKPSRPTVRDVATVPYRPWAVAWLGGSVLGIVNGVARELLYADRVGDLTAHQLSGVTLAALMGGYVYALQRRWPLPTAAAAVRVGGLWLGLTAAFEFGFGHYVDGATWGELLRDYNLLDGHIWALCLAWIAAAPSVVRWMRSRRAR